MRYGSNGSKQIQDYFNPTPPQTNFWWYILSIHISGEWEFKSINRPLANYIGLKWCNSNHSHNLILCFIFQWNVSRTLNWSSERALRLLSLHIYVKHESTFFFFLLDIYPEGRNVGTKEESWEYTHKCFLSWKVIQLWIGSQIKRRTNFTYRLVLRSDRAAHLKLIANELFLSFFLPPQHKSSLKANTHWELLRFFHTKFWVRSFSFFAHSSWKIKKIRKHSSDFRGFVPLWEPWIDESNWTAWFKCFHLFTKFCQMEPPSTHLKVVGDLKPTPPGVVCFNQVCLKN